MDDLGSCKRKRSRSDNLMDKVFDLVTATRELAEEMVMITQRLVSLQEARYSILEKENLLKQNKLEELHNQLISKDEMITCLEQRLRRKMFFF